MFYFVSVLKLVSTERLDYCGVFFLFDFSLAYMKILCVVVVCNYVAILEVSCLDRDVKISRWMSSCVESEAGYGSNKSYQAKKVWDVY